MGRKFASASVFDVDAGLTEAATRCEDMKGRVDKCTKLLLFMSVSHDGTVMQGQKEQPVNTIWEKKSVSLNKENYDNNFFKIGKTELKHMKRWTTQDGETQTLCVPGTQETG